MKEQHTVLVTGATGAQGGAVARHLLRRGHQVRALTRHTDSDAARALAELGAELMPGDFDDPAGLRTAADGVDAVYVMGTPFGTDPATETRQSIAVIEAARAAGVAHIVYASVASALDHTGVPHFESKAAVEEHLSTIDVPHTVIAPVAFLPGLDEPEIVSALDQGHYPSLLPGDVPLQQIDLDDLGAFATLALEQPERFDRRRIELASFEITSLELASMLSRALGREITVRDLHLEMADEAEDDLVRMIEFFRRGGYTVDIAALHAEFSEIDWTGADRWISREVPISEPNTKDMLM